MDSVKKKIGRALLAHIAMSVPIATVYKSRKRNLLSLLFLWFGEMSVNPED